MSNINQYHSGSGDNVAGDKNTTNNYGSQNLVQAARDIKKLLDQLSADYPSDSQVMIGARAADRINENPTLRQRIISALKEVGATALEKAVDHPAVSITVAGVKGFMAG